MNLRFCFRRLLPVLCCALAAGAAWSQSPIFRCGNEYTNNAADAKARGCKPIEGGNLTIVQGGGAAKPSAPAGDGRGAGAPPRSPGARNEGERVDSSAQRARDSDAREILEMELRRAEERLAELQAEYNQGQPARLASERGQAQRYDDRVADLKARIERAQSDVAGIQREIGRLPAPKGR